MAFELTDTNPFSTNLLNVTSADRPGFTFSPDYLTEDFAKWKESVLGDMSKDSVALNVLDKYLSSAPVSDVSSAITAQSLYGIKSLAQRQQAVGALYNTFASAGKLFTDLLTVGMNYGNINRQRNNAQLSAENQMKALDNQILAFKNEINDKFNTTVARNAVTMAAKNLRVTAGNLLEQTKESAYDATQDINMYESNAELKKIMLRSQQAQADVAAKLMKTKEVTQFMGDVANLGLMIETKGGTFAKSWGDIYAPLDIPNIGDKIEGWAGEAYDWTAGQLSSAKDWFKNTFTFKGIENE